MPNKELLVEMARKSDHPIARSFVRVVDELEANDQLTAIGAIDIIIKEYLDGKHISHDGELVDGSTDAGGSSGH